MNPEAKIKKYSALVASFAVCIGLGIQQNPANAQLPPTNMGKFVHKPGDNQYGSQAQKLRHPPQPVRTVSRPVMGGGGGGASYRYRKTRPKPKPDISLQAIPADEPIAPAGFPPLPEAVDIPGVERTNGLTAINNSSYSKSYGGGSSRPNPYQGSKQGYKHYSPGAFLPQKQSSPPMGGGDSMHQHYKHVPTQSSSSGVGYYKAKSAPLPSRTETFSTQGGPGTGTGANAAAGGPSIGKALKGLGREPKLEDRVYGNTGSAPEAPTPVQINQAATQDLSLPDDDFKYRRPPSATGRFMKNTVKRIGNRVGNVVNSMPIPTNFGR